VFAKFSKEGQLSPQNIIGEDSRRFEIDRVKDVRHAVSLRVGCQNID